MNLREQAAQGVFWSAAANWGYQLTTLIVFAVLSRLLTPEAFGLVALASVFTALTKLIAEQGLADALVQRAELEPEHLDTAFWLSVAVGVGLAILLAASAWLIADVINEPDVAPVIMWLSTILLFTGLSSVQRAILARELRFASLAARTLTSVVIGGIVGVLAAMAGFGVWSLVAQLLTIEIVGVVALWTASDWRPRLRFSRRHLRDLLSFGANVVGYRLLRFANTRIDNLMVGSFLGATALGFYVVAYRLLDLLINLTTATIGSVAFPVMSRIQEDRPKVQNAYYKSIRLTSVMAFPLFAGLIAIAPEATRLVFGSQWDESVPVMRILAIAGLLQSILFVNNIVMKSLGKPSWRLGIMGVTAVLLVAAFWVAVQWGIVAVATALVIVTYVMAPAWLIGASRLINLSFGRYLRQIGPPFIATAVMTGAVFASKLAVAELSVLWQVVVLVAVGVVTYTGGLWFLGGRPVAREALELARLAVPRRAQGTSQP
jgi:PST family polysaccharide transporter